MNPNQHTGKFLWHSPFTFLPAPAAGMVVSGQALPPTQQATAYTDEAEVFATVPAIARVEGALVAIADGANTYQFYYWFINRSTGVLTATWELKPLVLSDTYELAFRVEGSGLYKTGPASHPFTLPAGHTIVGLDVQLSFSGSIVGHGLGSTTATNDIAEWSDAMQRASMQLNYRDETAFGDATIYYNAPVYVDPGYKVIVTIRKNPFDKYTNL